MAGGGEIYNKPNALKTVQFTEEGIESLMLPVYKLAANKITNLIIYGKEVI